MRTDAGFRCLSVSTLTGCRRRGDLPERWKGINSCLVRQRRGMLSFQAQRSLQNVRPSHMSNHKKTPPYAFGLLVMQLYENGPFGKQNNR